MARPGGRRAARPPMRLSFQPGRDRGRTPWPPRSVPPPRRSRAGRKRRPACAGSDEAGRTAYRRGPLRSPGRRGRRGDRRGGDPRRRRPERAAAAPPADASRGSLRLQELLQRFRREAVSLYGIDRLVGDSRGDAPRPGAGELAAGSRASVLLVGPPGSGRQHDGHGHPLRPRAGGGRPVGAAGLRPAGAGADSRDARGRCRRQSPGAAGNRPRNAAVDPGRPDSAGNPRRSWRRCCSARPFPIAADRHGGAAAGANWRVGAGIARTWPPC